MSAKKIIVPDKKRERDPDLVNAEIALKRAAQKARLRALQAGIGVRTAGSLRNGRIRPF